jgi:transposase
MCARSSPAGPAKRSLSRRRHADDTTVLVLAKGKTRTGRLRTYVRDDRPFAGPDPPAAVFFYSRDRGGEHPEQHLAGFAGLVQADTYAGFNRLYEADRKPALIVACWAHARREFFDLARINKAPIATEAVARIDALFAIEREINGLVRLQRVGVQTERSRPRVLALETWLPEQRARVSKNSDHQQRHRLQSQEVDRADRFLDDGRLCMSNNAADIPPQNRSESLFGLPRRALVDLGQLIWLPPPRPFSVIDYLT